MRKVFIDANVLMEILYNRKKRAECVRLLSQQNTKYYLATLTVHILYYFGEKGNRTPEEIETLSDTGEAIALTLECINKARSRYAGKDFEDCLQAACAELGGCDQILTLDKNFQKNSGTKLKVQVIT